MSGAAQAPRPQGFVTKAAGRVIWSDMRIHQPGFLTRLVYARMKARGHGVIVNIIGGAGERMNAAYIAGSTGNAGLTFGAPLQGGELLH